MGQAQSAAFVDKKASYPTEPKRKRKKKCEKRDKSFWERIKSLISRLLRGHPTEGRISKITSVPKGNDKEKLTLTQQEIKATKDAKFYSENYDHVVCDHGRNKFRTVMSFLAKKDKFKSVDVPGKQAQIKVSQEVLRRLLTGIFVRFRHLHSDGKTLDGCFTAENICVPTYNKDQDICVQPYIDVKLDSLDLQSFKPYTDESGNKDLMKLGLILKHDIFSGIKLPSDLDQLITLLRDNPIKNKYLIYSHISLMGPRDQVSHFLWMYKRLMYLEKKMPNKYNNFMLKISKRINSENQDWRSQACENRFLDKLRPTGYTRDAAGLSRFYRNCVEHLFSNFEEQNTKSEAKPKDQKNDEQLVSMLEEEELQDYHIIYILTEAFQRIYKRHSMKRMSFKISTSSKILYCFKMLFLMWPHLLLTKGRWNEGTC